MGIVYHAHYLVWFEVGRGDYFRSIGQDYGEWERRGCLLPVSEAFARYHGSARFGDRIVVRTWLQQVQSRSVTLAYEVLSADIRQRLVTGWTKHVCVDQQGQVRRLPEEMLLSMREGT